MKVDLHRIRMILLLAMELKVQDQELQRVANPVDA